MVGICAILAGLLFALNQRKEVERVKNGKPAKIHDRSMDSKYGAAQVEEDEEVGKGGVALGGNSFKE